MTIEFHTLQHGSYFTAPFNNMWSLKFRAQLKNAFFATVNQMFSGSSQLPTTAEHTVIKSSCTVQTTKQCLAVVVSWGTAKYLTDGSEKHICWLTFEF